MIKIDKRRDRRRFLDDVDRKLYRHEQNWRNCKGRYTGVMIELDPPIRHGVNRYWVAIDPDDRIASMLLPFVQYKEWSHDRRFLEKRNMKKVHRPHCFSSISEETYQDNKVIQKYLLLVRHWNKWSGRFWYSYVLNPLYHNLFRSRIAPSYITHVELVDGDAESYDAFHYKQFRNNKRHRKLPGWGRYRDDWYYEGAVKIQKGLDDTKHQLDQYQNDHIYQYDHTGVMMDLLSNSMDFYDDYVDYLGLGDDYHYPEED